MPRNRTDGAAGNNSDMGMQYPAGTSYSSSSMMPSSSMPQHLAQRPDNHGVYSSVGAPGSNGMGAWLQQQPASQQQHTMSSLPTFLAGNGGMGGAPPPPTAFNLDGGNASGGAAGGGGIPFDHLFDPNFVETNALDGLYDFDLAEFWTKVYPGEVSRGLHERLEFKKGDFMAGREKGADKRGGPVREAALKATSREREEGLCDGFGPRTCFRMRDDRSTSAGVWGGELSQTAGRRLRRLAELQDTDRRNSCGGAGLVAA